MKSKMKVFLGQMHRYNAGSLALDVFGLDAETIYDALVVAPGWKPTRILHDPAWHVTQLTAHSYISGYLVERSGLKIAWIQTAAGACNLIDHLAICAELQFKKLIFVGAVGSLCAEFELGALCTPAYSIAGVFANAYLNDWLGDYQPFGHVYPDKAYLDHVVELAARSGYALRKAPVFCTDSIALEYAHLDEIKATGAKLIEMETSSFYLMADLLEVPAIALLAVSDNSATGDPLIGQDENRIQAYHRCRSEIIPELICKIAQEA